MNNRRSGIEGRRKALGMSRAMLARASGLTTQAIYNVEATTKNVRPETVERLAAALDGAEAARAASSTGRSARTDLAERVAALEDLMHQVRAEVVAIAEARGVVLPEKQQARQGSPELPAPMPRPAVRVRKPRG